MNHHRTLLVLLLAVVSALALPQQQVRRGSRRFQSGEELPTAPEQWRPERTIRRVDTDQPQASRRQGSLEREAEIPSRRQVAPTQRRSSVTNDERTVPSRRASYRVSASPAPEFETASSVVSAVREQAISSRTQRRSSIAEADERIAPRNSFSRRRDSGVHQVTSPSSSEFDTASSVLTPVKQQLVSEQAQRRTSIREQEPEVIPRQNSSRRRQGTRGRSKTESLEPEVRRSEGSSRRGGRRLSDGVSRTTTAAPTTTVTTSTTSTTVTSNVVTTTPTPIISNQTTNDADAAASILNSDAAHIIENDIPEVSAAPLQTSAAEVQGSTAADVLRSRAANTRHGATRSSSGRRKPTADTDNEIVVRPRGGGNTRRNLEGPNVPSRVRQQPFNDISRTAATSEVNSRSNTQRTNTGRSRSRAETRSSANDDQASTSRSVRNRNRDADHSKRASADEETVNTTLPQQEIHKVDGGRRKPVASRPERLNVSDRSIAPDEVNIPKRNRVRNELNRGQVLLGNDETESSARQSTAENLQRRNGNSSARSGTQTEVTKQFRTRNRSNDGSRRHSEAANTSTESESLTPSRTAALRNKAAENGRGKQRQNGRRGSTTSVTEGSDYQETEDRSRVSSRSSNNNRYEPASGVKGSGRRTNKETQQQILPSIATNAEGSEVVEQLQLQEALKLKDENEPQEEDIQKKGEAEDSFITRSSHQVVTVTAFPNSVENSQQKTVAPPASKQRFFRPGENRRPGHNNQLRTASLAIAPTPASNRAGKQGETLEVQKVTVSKSEDSNKQRSRNNEDNNISNTALHRFSSRKTSGFNFTRIKTTGKPIEREELKAVPTTETERQLPPPSSQINPTVSHVGRSGIYFKQQHSQKPTENLSNLSKKSAFVSTTPLSLSKVSIVETRLSPNEKLQESTSSTRKGAALATTPSISPDTKKVATSYVAVVMSNGAPAKAPRFSARYRSELFRATGHGSRVTTTPVYVPTVPTVRTSPSPTSSFTSQTSDPVLSAIGKMAPLLGFFRTEVHSPWTNRL